MLLIQQWKWKVNNINDSLDISFFNYGNESRLLFLNVWKKHYEFELTDLNISSKLFAINFKFQIQYVNVNDCVSCARALGLKSNHCQFGLSIQAKCFKMSVEIFKFDFKVQHYQVRSFRFTHLSMYIASKQNIQMKSS